MAKGEFFLIEKFTGKKNKRRVECYYGTAITSLKPLIPYVETVCYRNHMGRKICRNITQWNISNFFNDISNNFEWYWKRKNDKYLVK